MKELPGCITLIQLNHGETFELKTCFLLQNYYFEINFRC